MCICLHCISFKLLICANAIWNIYKCSLDRCVLQVVSILVHVASVAGNNDRFLIGKTKLGLSLRPAFTASVMFIILRQLFL